MLKIDDYKTNKGRKINSSFKLKYRGICGKIKKIMLILDERKLVKELDKMNKSRPLYDSGTEKDEFRIKLSQDILNQREELKRMKWEIKYIKKHPLFSMKGQIYLELGKLIDVCFRDGYIEYKDDHNKKLYISPNGMRLIDSWQNVWDILKHPFILRIIEFAIPSFTIYQIIKLFR